MLFHNSIPSPPPCYFYFCSSFFVPTNNIFLALHAPLLQLMIITRITLSACTTHSRNDASRRAYPPSARKLSTSTRLHVLRIVRSVLLKWPSALGYDLPKIRLCVRRGRRMRPRIIWWEGRWDVGEAGRKGGRKTSDAWCVVRWALTSLMSV